MTQRKTIIHTAQHWYDAAQDKSNPLIQRLMHMESAFNHTEDALTAYKEDTKRLQTEIEQCHQKSTCCCGDYIKTHTNAMDAGHTPVSMYSNEMDNLNQQLEKTLKENHTLKTIQDLIYHTTGNISNLRHDQLYARLLDIKRLWEQNNAQNPGS